MADILKKAKSSRLTFDKQPAYLTHMRSGFEAKSQGKKNESPSKTGKDHEAKKQMNLQERITYSRIESEKKIILEEIEVLIRTMDLMLS